jgi:hypothetical protein
VTKPVFNGSHCDGFVFNTTDSEYLEEWHLRRDIRTFHELHRLAV